MFCSAFLLDAINKSQNFHTANQIANDTVSISVLDKELCRNAKVNVTKQYFYVFSMGVKLGHLREGKNSVRVHENSVFR